ncbi:Rv1733c family protein [Mycobacterium genavense]|uniref:Rv1733c family protein n=1 Tax=Mycobacterium genavense TaxID=36812 RepID=UPI00046EA70B
METYTLDPRCWRIARIFGRNPLLRRTDRIEALALLIAFVVLLLAIPFAGVAGGVTYSVRDRLYVQEAQERHAIQPTITETAEAGSGITVVQAKWPIANAERTGVFELPYAGVGVGDRVEVWVDRKGDHVARPTPVWHAVADASAAALGTLLVMGFGVALLVLNVRARLNRIRSAQWDRKISCLQEDGGRTIH